ncbi:hypothetical protein, partial [Staphylococcus pseudintermedius]|uniref:hypothetical protein n=1 Tax=Staphylococcus pseudintermedius TaxID=283734 RepID=UPI001C92E8D8
MKGGFFFFFFKSKNRGSETVKNSKSCCFCNLHRDLRKACFLFWWGKTLKKKICKVKKQNAVGGKNKNQKKKQKIKGGGGVMKKCQQHTKQQRSHQNSTHPAPLHPTQRPAECDSDRNTKNTQ